MSVTDRIRQPEYTGENRCTPCTAVNVSIAVGTSAFIAVVSIVLGVGVFVLSLVTIYLRGYLVPGTPTLTKRYFPERVLRWFDKGVTTPISEKSVEIDPERVLLDVNVVEPCQGGTDLCLTDEFREAWRADMHTFHDHDSAEELLADALNVSSSDNRISFDHHDEAVVAYTDDAVIGQWGSRAAVIGDIAAATELSQRSSNWPNLTSTERARVLMSLRIFIEQCPECDGSIQVKQEVVESCCRSYDVVAAACQDCDSHLFEIEWDDTVAADEIQTQPKTTQTSV